LRPSFSTSPVGAGAAATGVRRLSVAVVVAVVLAGGVVQVAVLAGAPRPAAADTVGGVVVTSVSWTSDYTLSFTWTDPPPPDQGSSWSGGTWWVTDGEGNQLCTDYLNSDSSTSYSTTCDPANYVVPGHTCYLYLNVAGTAYDEYAESDATPVTFPGTPTTTTVPPTTAPPRTTVPSVTVPSVSTPAPPASTTTTTPTLESPRGSASIDPQDTADCLAHNPLLAVDAEVRVKLAAANARMTTLEDEKRSLDKQMNDVTQDMSLPIEKRNQQLAKLHGAMSELVRFTIPEQQKNIAALQDGLDRMAASSAKERANCGGAGVTGGGGALPGAESAGTARLEAQPGTRGFQSLPWFVDVQSGVLHWTEHLTTFSCRFGTVSDPSRASFVMQRCHYVATPTAMAVLRGTEFTVAVNSTATTFIVLSGSLDVTDLGQHRVVHVTAGHTTTVAAGFVPSDPVPFDPSTLDRWWTQGAGWPFVLATSLGAGVLAGAVWFVVRRRRRGGEARSAPTGEVDGMAIAAFVLGVLWLFWIGSIVATVLGHVSLGRIKHAGRRGRGLATAGAVLGWVGVASLVLVATVGTVTTLRAEDQKSADRILSDAVAASRRQSSVEVTGSMGMTAAGPMMVDLVVSSASAGGVVVEGSTRMWIVVTPSTLYLQGNAGFWQQYTDAGTAATMAGQWVSVPTSDPRFGDLTGLMHVWDGLRPTGTLTKGGPTSFDGRSVVPLTDDAGKTLYVADNGPPLIVGIARSATAANGAGQVVMRNYGTAPVPAAPVRSTALTG